ncbi:PEP-CTERM sorting domain-containing protein [Aquabacterium sp. A7-Y]|uniref:PEP-CTERM sorting domain-containing protein n=1 Tax=Aquabacterium sp. A7-Y TaxID=1349605 RepID=UPI00223DD0A9|nr:PEP-CTERM sorting domain-containing protein [Aquabacterium sp. A7-Y]MCW7538001.1 PEP-CTERM sorting domain-containing protein [Aquabacterium sp. A7-Y]
MQGPTRRRASRVPHPKGLAVLALAAQAAVLAGAAHAADTSWTGASGQPYWDLPGNWSAGAPADLASRALLGEADTELRRGDFKAGQLLGSGRLAVSGGTLELKGAGSQLGHLTQTGGELSGIADLTVRSLDLKGGNLMLSGKVTVQGTARLSGATTQLDFNTKLDLLGDTYMEGSFDTVLGGLHVGAGGTLHDQSTEPDRRLWSFGAIEIDGRYVKTGSGATALDLYADYLFENRGVIDVQEGTLGFNHNEAGGRWHNAGELHVREGAGAYLSMTRDYAASNSGRIRVDGRMNLWLGGSGFGSSGEFVVGKTGRLFVEQISYWGFTRFSGGLHNDGSVTLSAYVHPDDPGTGEPRNDFSIGGAGLTGRGHLELVEARLTTGDLNNDGSLHAKGYSELVTGALDNRGRLRLDDYSDLIATSYVQTAAEAEFWLAGHAKAETFLLADGVIGAGGEDRVGIGGLEGDTRFEGVTMEVDVALDDSADRLVIAGAVDLGGEVFLNFLDGLTYGTFRILEVNGTMTGRFNSFASNIDPASYRYSFTYGKGFVDLTVAAVPEPGTYALMGLGLIGVAAWRRRRASAG